MIIKYKTYLEYIDNKLAKMFANQNKYIKCKKGCSFCCKEGEFPMSELEFLYMMTHYIKLTKEKIDIADKNIQNLINKKPDKLYSCPFLINDECSVYSGRPIICRTFGLIYYTKNDKYKIPFCVEKGLNYSEIYDKTTDTFNSSLINDNEKPNAYNIERPVLRSKKIENQFGIFFGQDKSMYEWLKQEFEAKE